MDNIQAGLGAIASEQAFVDRQIALHQKRLTDAIRKLERKILTLFSEQIVRENGRLTNTKAKLLQAQKLHKELVILFEQEFGTAFKSVVKDFDKIAEAIEIRFAAFDEAYKFTGVSQTIISTLKTTALREFEAFGTVMRDRVAAALYEEILVGGKFLALQQAVRSILTGRYSKVGRPMTTYTKQMAFDQVMSFHNQLNLAEASRADLNHFLYYGNAQFNTRPFCRARIGKIFSRTEIESWTHHWDGKSGPAMTHRGGYNCRHSFVPVQQDWFKNKEQDIKDAIRGS